MRSCPRSEDSQAPKFNRSAGGCELSNAVCAWNSSSPPPQSVRSHRSYALTAFEISILASQSRTNYQVRQTVEVCLYAGRAEDGLRSWHFQRTKTHDTAHCSIASNSDQIALSLLSCRRSPRSPLWRPEASASSTPSNARVGFLGKTRHILH